MEKDLKARIVGAYNRTVDTAFNYGGLASAVILPPVLTDNPLLQMFIAVPPSLIIPGMTPFFTTESYTSKRPGFRQYCSYQFPRNFIAAFASSALTEFYKNPDLKSASLAAVTGLASFVMIANTILDKRVLDRLAEKPVSTY